MSTPTPETDALLDYLKAQFPATDGHLLLREKIGKLERERNESLQELEEYRSVAEKIGATKAISARDAAIAERDQLRKVCDELSKALMRQIPISNQLGERKWEAINLYNSLPHVAEKKICSQTSK